MAILCSCTGAREADVKTAIQKNLESAAQENLGARRGSKRTLTLFQLCGIRIGCGGCKSSLKALVDKVRKEEAERPDSAASGIGARHLSR